MSQSQDYIVPSRSWDNIRGVATSIRNRFGLSDHAYFPVIELIELVLDQKLNMVRFEVGTHAEMDGAEGLTCPKGEFIQLREDVYEAACRGEGRGRFTAAHELGHFAMHTNVPHTRKALGESVPTYKLAEPQANQFAAELLMPDGFCDHLDDEQSLMERHGVSFEAAGHRLRYLKKKGRL
ncbi:Neutral zinc metallopeptidase [Sulfitobacter noctilucicola]|uniref:Zn-dependent peptidase ImmA (M78 family) n=1 Tax=Sulfitobacter noctilucicola TaxID=1342301 RepID=A0A7W6Q4J3_9RHOB|nr:ImmA/IrrE family metallo-endopeptidase [Sulfitobacter noctilucicola]KIN62570.1 Neutral zinc metallopeptidase [Sulfitobacter noctilucicola]MBB4172897.1 Zn-dependent peptidase ImmA (M78 family) [Sulfitobacter noctilucicola]